MILNHIIIALRNLKKYKSYSLINITGLAVGMAAFLMILLFVSNELSYDRHHENFENIYRVNKIGRVRNSDYELAITPSALGPALQDEIPETAAVTRIRPQRDAVLRYEGQTFVEKGVIWVDSGFLDIFTTPFTLGNPESALVKPNSLVLTESAARKYFGNRDPMGKHLNLNDEEEFLVTGVVKDIPATSHFHYDILLALPPDSPTRWLGNSDNTYILLKEGASLSAVEARLKSISEKYVYPQLESVLGMSVAAMRQKGEYSGFRLQPLRDIHFGTQVRHQLSPSMDKSYIWLFSLIAAAIILIACINFTNLASARSVLRAREVGVRKTLGSSRSQLIRQFLGETLVMSVLAMGLALILVNLFLPAFGTLAHKNLSSAYLFRGTGLLIFLGLTLFTGLAAGLYPSLFLSSFRPVKVLKSTLEIKGKKSIFRNGLVIFQFTVTIILTTSTLIINRQMDYINQKDLGFNREQLLIVKNCQSVEALNPLMTELRRSSQIKSVCNSTSIPGSGMGDRNYWIDGNESQRIMLRNFYADEAFTRTYEIDITRGRFFDKQFNSDANAVVINARAAAEFGVENPVGRFLAYKDSSSGELIRRKIVGVMNDIHMRSLHEKISPLVIYLKPADYSARYLTMRLNTGDLDGSIAQLKSLWKRFATDQPLEYSFFDEEFNRHYTAELRTGQIFTIFTLLALLVACLGLFGLTSFTTSLRMKEIGIRKVMGAKTAQLFKLLVGDIFRLIGIAVVIGWPVAFFFMKNWLQNLAYRTPMPYEVFAAAALIAVFAAILTISWHTVRASLMNPVKTLRYE